MDDLTHLQARIDELLQINAELARELARAQAQSPSASTITTATQLGIAATLRDDLDAAAAAREEAVAELTDARKTVDRIWAELQEAVARTAAEAGRAEAAEAELAELREHPAVRRALRASDALTSVRPRRSR